MFSNRKIACVAVPSFAIAVERVRDVRLRDRPVVVAQSDSPRSRCLAVSSEAQLYGIRSGQLVSHAVRLCRGLVIVEPKPEIYGHARSAITDIVSTFSPLVEPARSGRHFLDLTGTSRLFGNPAEIASTIQKKIVDALSLTTDTGVAVNKLVSRVATIDAEPFEVVEVVNGSENDYLAPYRVDVLPAVNRDIRRQLLDLNILSVEQVRNVSVDQLIPAVGPMAFLLARQSHGIDPSPVTPPSKKPHIVLQTSLTEDSNSADVIDKIVHDLALDAALMLMTSGIEPVQITVTLIYSDNKRVQFGRPLQTRQHTPIEIIGIVTTLLLGQNRRIRIRAIELDIETRNFSANQQSLWTPELSESSTTIHPQRRIVERYQKSEQLLGAISLIRNRFGKSAVAWGA